MFVPEVEPNLGVGQATVIDGANVVLSGNIFPAGDTDLYSFTGNAGDRVYVATQTLSSSVLTDSVLEIFASDGTTLLEDDDDNGVFPQGASSIAGLTLPADGTYYVRVRAFAPTALITPYHLHFARRSGSPVAETEPNEIPGTNPIGAGWVSGALSSAGDADFFTIDLAAGDTLFASLDLDPERDNVEWNGTLGLGPFGGFLVTPNDPGDVGPDSEAYFMTVRTPGTYGVRVASFDDSFGTYQLSLSVHPPSPNCTTYTNGTDVPLPDLARSVSTLDVPADVVIGDIDVHLELSHTAIADLDVQLIAPDGTIGGLFSDIPSATDEMAVTIDDEAAIPLGALTVMQDMIVQPERTYRLSWFDGMRAQGTWTLAVYDDAEIDTGSIEGWGLTICTAPAAPSCPAGTSPRVVYSTDFETDDAGFTHSGTADEWERGLPTFVPILSCNSGTHCFKTDLDETYDVSSSQDLISPSVSLAGVVGPITLRWAQKYQLTSANSEHASVDVRNADDSSPTRVFEHYGPSMLDLVGAGNGEFVDQSAGWGVRTADISAYAGNDVEVVFHLDANDDDIQYAGWAIDDVSITACAVVCGDGQVGAGEQCDDGDVESGDCCSSTCQYEALGSSCADADLCDGAETCNATGTCVAGTPVTCSASDECHVAGECAAQTGMCSNPAAPNGTPCGNGGMCVSGACMPGAGGAGGSSGAGGAGGAGTSGAGGVAGSAGGGGNAGLAGAAGANGGAGSGGMPTGGGAGEAGAGGEPSTGGGGPGGGGEAGDDGAGGSSTGGSSTGGSSTGGSSTGGSSAGVGGEDEPGGAGSGDRGDGKSSPDEDGGCGCSVPGNANRSGFSLLSGALLLVLASRRRRHRATVR